MKICKAQLDLESVRAGYDIVGLNVRGILGVVDTFVLIFVDTVENIAGFWGCCGELLYCVDASALGAESVWWILRALAVVFILIAAGVIATDDFEGKIPLDLLRLRLKRGRRLRRLHVRAEVLGLCYMDELGDGEVFSRVIEIDLP